MKHPLRAWPGLGAWLVLAAPGPAHAFGIGLQNGAVQRWPGSRVDFWLDVDGTRELDDGSDLLAVRRAAATWNAIPCAALTLEEVGTTASTSNLATEQVTDGQNVVVWVEDGSWPFGSAVLGVTLHVTDYFGEIEEADIAFNGELTTWTTRDSAPGTDVESIAAHELGHLVGLKHVLGGEALSDPPTMTPEVPPGIAGRSLTADDASGLCFLYPGDGYTCGADCDCGTIVERQGGLERNAGQLRCMSGACGPDSTPAESGVCQADVAPASPSSPASPTGPSGAGGSAASDPQVDPARCGCDHTFDCDRDSEGLRDCACDPECTSGCGATAAPRTAAWAWVGLLLVTLGRGARPRPFR